MGEESSNALKGKRVVVTRAAEQSELLVKALREKGAVPVLVPMVAFGPPDEPGLLEDAIRGIQQYDWIFLTSQNAVRALEERSEVLGMSLAKATAAIRVAAVGPATAEVARNAGLKIAYMAAKHQGVGLAEELATEIQGKHVLLPRSDRASPELVARLKGLGAKVKEIVAYKTIRPDGASLDRAAEMVSAGADAVLFFSPSAVHHLQDLLGNEKFLEFSKRTVFAAIGPVTGETLKRARVGRVVSAVDTTVAGVLTALTDYFLRPGSTPPAGTRPE